MSGCFKGILLSTIIATILFSIIGLVSQSTGAHNSSHYDIGKEAMLGGGEAYDFGGLGSLLGETTCPECNGTGEVACPECDGTGGDKVCTRCGGTGVEECLTCHGTGRCFACNGTGKCQACESWYAVYDTPCPSCGGTGICGVCDGSGDC